MPLYRCANCGNDAEHPTPKCVPCGLDPKNEPRAVQMFTELVTVHFDPPHAVVAGWGLGHAACDPTKKVGRVQDRFTGEREVVNCSACKASEAFAGAATKPPRPHESIDKVGKAEPGQALKKPT